MRINQLSPVNAGYGTDSPKAQAQAKMPSELNVKATSKEADTLTTDVVERVADDKVFNDELIDKSVAQANKSLKSKNRVIERAVHEVTRAVMYTVKDTVTNEVIAEFPPKRIQDMIAKMWELAGLFVDEKA